MSHTIGYYRLSIIIKVKVFRDRPRWPKGFRVD